MVVRALHKPSGGALQLFRHPGIHVSDCWSLSRHQSPSKPPNNKFKRVSHFVWTVFRNERCLKLNRGAVPHPTDQLQGFWISFTGNIWNQIIEIWIQNKKSGEISQFTASRWLFYALSDPTAQRMHWLKTTVCCAQRLAAEAYEPSQLSYALV